jgi:hypothetical protein
MEQRLARVPHKHKVVSSNLTLRNQFFYKRNHNMSTDPKDPNYTSGEGGPFDLNPTAPPQEELDQDIADNPVAPEVLDAEEIARRHAGG